MTEACALHAVVRIHITSCSSLGAHCSKPSCGPTTLAELARGRPSDECRSWTLSCRPGSTRIERTVPAVATHCQADVRIQCSSLNHACLDQGCRALAFFWGRRGLYQLEVEPQAPSRPHLLPPFPSSPALMGKVQGPKADTNLSHRKPFLRSPFSAQ